MLRFIVDTQLPAALAVYLSGYDLDAIHTTFYPAGHLLKDREIREKAVAEDRIIITKDSDFFDYFFVKGAPPGYCFSKSATVVTVNCGLLLRRI